MVGARKTILITDLDNTLFDWVELWHACFSAMLGEIQQISGIGYEKLKREIRKVHQRHGTSEYSFLIEELPHLRERFRDEPLTTVFQPAIEAYRAQRRQKLRLFVSHSCRDPLEDKRGRNRNHRVYGIYGVLLELPGETFRPRWRI